ncbi:channel-forming protein [Actinoplanes sp. SE50]|uniref:copper transporter n=1 Tax=unclassified Actinoplanes TaxID=2626549 RepID=UPI00023ECF4A|nr:MULTISPECIES: copper transporter [unclassified Actinoplanes]AEV87233.1 putative channel-forming protein [Actinoplanes sp. SE50/110]ATO85634.1 channel-forming protein [Actinoplanes sp. SE50]SLM03047.1 channel-forming protein [Actinoplanes sp. SE50/110]
MINFRYHVVSLTAVFLALAIGLVVGTAALNGPVSENLREQLTTLNKDNNVKRDQVNQYKEELNRSQDFAAQVAPWLTTKLTGRKLAVVVLPGGRDSADGVVKMLTTAGATITARITVEDKFLDPGYATQLLDLADQSSQPTIPSAGLPSNSDGVETASALLALTLDQGATVVNPDDVTAVLTALAKPGYISVAEKASGGAEGIVLVAGAPATDKDAGKKTANAVTVANQFHRYRPLVVAGDGAGDNNLVSAIRSDPTLVKQISTVDNASSVQGQVATAMATHERLVQNKVGQYGLGTGATSLVPSAAP